MKKYKIGGIISHLYSCLQIEYHQSTLGEIWRESVLMKRLRFGIPGFHFISGLSNCRNRTNHIQYRKKWRDWVIGSKQAILSNYFYWCLKNWLDLEVYYQKVFCFLWCLSTRSNSWNCTDFFHKSKLEGNVFN